VSSFETHRTTDSESLAVISSEPNASNTRLSPVKLVSLSLTVVPSKPGINSRKIERENRGLKPVGRN
jgi:hypothetical protein